MKKDRVLAGPLRQCDEAVRSLCVSHFKEPVVTERTTTHEHRLHYEPSLKKVVD